MKTLAILILLIIHLETKAQSDTIAYRSFEVDTKSEKAVIYDRQSSIDMNAKPIMITNGGMFDPDYSPHGLLICNHKVYKKLDTRTAKNANFYLQPNGVFFIEGGKYAVLSTKVFQEKYPDLKDKHPDFATQSGPMLVIDDSINSAFTKGSPNINIRSGVGILPNGNPIFIICRDINFHDFAALFKDKFGCRSALFLDGAISEMFVGSQEEQKLADYNFGPIIAVIQLDRTKVKP
jgi:uncharacterized protein YigE (DUF2233 family)